MVPYLQFSLLSFQTSFLVTPFIGQNLRGIGVRFALIAGIFTGGVCCLLSGFLEFFTPGYSFVILVKGIIWPSKAPNSVSFMHTRQAILIRVVHATGNAMVITATFTFTAIEFQNSVGKVFSYTRTAMNVAQMFGPAFGGAIYNLGGFYLPFVTMGSLQVRN